MRNSKRFVDRDKRSQLAGEMRRFLAGELSAFQFDEAVSLIHDETKDETVRRVTEAVWYHYDDCDDHYVALTKPQWDYFQRLLLVLESDRHLVASNLRWEWSGTQLIAALALLGFAACVWQFGWGEQLLIFAIPFGLVSMGISKWRGERDRLAGRESERLVPFSSVGEMRMAYFSVGGFRKARYRTELGEVRIRSKMGQFALWLQMVVPWLLLSPVVLAFQMLPRRRDSEFGGSEVAILGTEGSVAG